MTPASAHKDGARYRYYVSAPVMQGRREEAGSVPRVPAPEIEQAVIALLREEMGSTGTGEPAPTDRDFVEQHLRRVEVRAASLLVEIGSAPDENGDSAASAVPGRIIALPWSAPASRVRRRVVVPPNAGAESLKPMRSDTRETLLVAIAKARRWFLELSSGRVASFGSIGEGCCERYVRSVLPLALLAPAVITAAIEGRLPEGWGVSQLLRSSATSWDEQTRRLGLGGTV
jgi:site-specific DNA recombinase